MVSFRPVEYLSDLIWGPEPLTLFCHMNSSYQRLCPLGEAEPSHVWSHFNYRSISACNSTPLFLGANGGLTSTFNFRRNGRNTNALKQIELTDIRLTKSKMMPAKAELKGTQACLDWSELWQPRLKRNNHHDTRLVSTAREKSDIEASIAPRASIVYSWTLGWLEQSRSSAGRQLKRSRIRQQRD